MRHPAYNAGFLWEELRLALALWCPWALADDAVTAGGAAKGASGGQAALSAGCPWSPTSPAGLSVQETEGNRHWGAPEPSRPSHSSTAGAESSLDTDICSSAGSPHPPVLSAAVTVLLPTPHPRSPPLGAAQSSQHQGNRSSALFW